MGMHMESWVDWGFKGHYAKAEHLKAAALRAGSGPLLFSRAALDSRLTCAGFPELLPWLLSNRTDLEVSLRSCFPLRRFLFPLIATLAL